MKSFAVFIVLVAAVANVQCLDGEKTTDSTKMRQNEQQQMRQMTIPMNANEQMQMRQQMPKAEQTGDNMLGSAYGKPAAYGGNYQAAAAYPSVPAPPCPRNYLFSCQPNLTPAPCAQQAAAYGSVGAYSHVMPQYLPAPYQY